MKTLLSLASVALVSLSFSASAAMDPQLEKTLVSLCKAGASNSVIQLNDTVKSNHINKQRIYPKLMCNGESFHNFALTNNADRTAKRIAPYMQGNVIIRDISMNYDLDELYVVNF